MCTVWYVAAALLGAHNAEKVVSNRTRITIDVKTMASKGKLTETDFGCEYSHNRALPEEMAERMLNRFTGEEAVKEEEVEEFGELKSVKIHEKDLEFLIPYLRKVRYDQMLKQEMKVLTDAQKKHIHNKNQGFAFGKMMGHPAVLDNAQLLLSTVEPERTWEGVDRQMKAAAEVASVPKGHMDGMEQIRYFQELVTTAKGGHWKRSVKGFRKKKRAAAGAQKKRGDWKRARKEAAQAAARTPGVLQTFKAAAVKLVTPGAGRSNEEKEEDVKPPAKRELDLGLLAEWHAAQVPGGEAARVVAATAPAAATAARAAAAAAAAAGGSSDDSSDEEYFDAEEE